MMTAKEYEALKNSIPETRPEGERGAAAVAAHLKGKARAHDLPDGMDDRRMTPGEFVRHSMQAAGWPEPGDTVQLQDIRDENAACTAKLKNKKYRVTYLDKKCGKVMASTVDEHRIESLLRVLDKLDYTELIQYGEA